MKMSGTISMTNQVPACERTSGPARAAAQADSTAFRATAELYIVPERQLMAMRDEALDRSMNWSSYDGLRQFVSSMPKPATPEANLRGQASPCSWSWACAVGIRR